MKRPEAEIIKDLQKVDNALSPENLHWDGERDPADALADELRLNAKRNKLVKELGREPTFNELYPGFGASTR